MSDWRIENLLENLLGTKKKPETKERKKEKTGDVYSDIVSFVERLRRCAWVINDERSYDREIVFTHYDLYTIETLSSRISYNFVSPRTIVAKCPSESQPGKEYIITLSLTDDNCLIQNTCTCAWKRFHFRPCKHIIATIFNLLTAYTRQKNLNYYESGNILDNIVRALDRQAYFVVNHINNPFYER